MRNQFAGVESAPPDHALERLEGRALHVAIHEVDGGGRDPGEARRVVDGGVGYGGFPGDAQGGRPHVGVAAVREQEIGHVPPREREEHVVDERDARRRTLDVEQDAPPSEDDHAPVPLAAGIQAGPMQRGS